jgi:glycosyltransferase involved in cell wall biosynthesis
MKGKIGHSMSLGLPVVTTAIGAEGMALVDRETALIADEPAAFASAVVRLYRDEQLWTALAQRAKAHVETHFSEAVARERLRAIFPTANEPVERDASEVDARRA